MKRLPTLLLLLSLFGGWNYNTFAQDRKTCLGGVAKFEPIDGKRLLIIGQDLGAVGGLEGYSQGYIDHFKHIPAGITTYTALPPLIGLWSKTNYGAGDIYAEAFTNNETFKYTTLAIGLYLVDQEKAIAEGKQDTEIKKLAQWIKGLNRPVYLRVGYEFDGDHNHYDTQYYIDMWKRIIDIFDENEVMNCDYVWQSDGVHDIDYMSKYYPGDEYVDWFSFSYFTDAAGAEILQMAKQHNKPVMITEATPRGYDLDDKDSKVWEEWFEPMFRMLDSHPSIKALSYINADWESQSMWKGKEWGDTRLQANTKVQEAWNKKINNGQWLLGDENLYDYIGFPLDDINPNCADEANVNAISNEPEKHTFFTCYAVNNHLQFRFKKPDLVEAVQVLSPLTGKAIHTWSYPLNQDINLTSGIYLLRIISKKGHVYNTKLMVCF